MGQAMSCFEIGNRRRIKTLLEIMTNEADTSAKIIVIGVGVQVIML